MPTLRSEPTARKTRLALEQLERRETPAVADLTVTNTDGLAQMVDGTTTTYTVEVTNLGPDAATNATIHEDFPTHPAVIVNWAAQVSGGASVTQTGGTGDFTIGANIPAGGKVTISANLFAFPQTSFLLTNTATAAVGPGDADPNLANNSATDTTRIGRERIPDDPGSSLIAVGSDAGASAHVAVYDARTGQLLHSFEPFGDFLGGVRVATGDVTGDGRDDVVVGAGPGGPPHVKVYDGSTMAEVASFYAFDPAFRGGVYVAAARFNAPPLVGPVGPIAGQVVVGAGPGAAPHVKVFGVGSGGAFPDTPLASFLAFDGAFRGGVRVAAGDVDGLPGDELVVGAGPGAAPHVKVFNGAGHEAASFLAYDPAFAGGVFVAVGDVDGAPTATGGRRSEIITTAGPSHVKVFGGGQLAAGAGSGTPPDAAFATPPGEQASFLAFGGFLGGARVATADRDNDGRADLVLGAGPGATPHVRVVSLQGLAELDSFLAFDERFSGGVFVG
jgi:uncharacterized repeat protein (TIGR01451 family)